jgi:hypothetical protein
MVTSERERENVKREGRRKLLMSSDIHEHGSAVVV